MDSISKIFYNKHKDKKLTKLSLATRQEFLDTIDNTPGFEIDDLFWSDTELYKYLNPKKKKRTEIKFIECYAKIKDKKIIEFYELSNSVRIYFFNGRRSNPKYKKRCFSDDELIELDGTLGHVQTYNVYECNDISVPTGRFNIEVEAKTWKEAIEKVKNERPTKQFYNAEIIDG